MKLHTKANLRVQHTTFKWITWVFPTLLLFIIFIAWPLSNTFSTSLYRIDGSFLGAQSFSNILVNDTLQNEYFNTGLQNTVLITFFSVLVSILLSLFVSYFVSLGFRRRLARFLQGFFLVPYIVTGLALGLAFALIFDGDRGLLNTILNSLNIGSVYWLENRWTSIFVISVLNIWRLLPFQIIVFSIGFSLIPKNIFYLSKTFFQNFFSKLFLIYIPQIRTTFYFILITSFIFSMKSFPVELFPDFAIGSSISYANAWTITYLIYYWSQVPNFQSYGAALSIIFVGINILIYLFGLTIYQTQKIVFKRFRNVRDA